jgi:thymidylate synthase (FAD)
MGNQTVVEHRADNQLEITLRNDFDVTLIDAMGDDHRIVQAARISQLGAETMKSGESARLIKFLMDNRHGSPFEHCTMQWMISAPIFVWREFHRHRIASYNEQSSRWTQLEPVFYVPSDERPTKQVGRTGEYRLEQDQELDLRDVNYQLFNSYMDSYLTYQELLDKGVAREVARAVLPVSIFSTCFVTMNLRALMNFLSLRTHETAQWEIRRVANLMQADFSLKFPATYDAWVANGKVAP